VNLNINVVGPEFDTVGVNLVNVDVEADVEPSDDGDEPTVTFIEVRVNTYNEDEREPHPELAGRLDKLVRLYLERNPDVYLDALGEPGDYYNDDMDGDHGSALASAGWGTDEDYGGYDGGGDDW